MEESENVTIPSTSAESVISNDGIAEQPQLLIKRLQEENRKMKNEFDSQRAKLKELFIQKEAEYSKIESERLILQRELDEMKSQFVVADMKSENELRFKEMRAHEEISSLQQLVQDTIEESAILKADLERLKEEHNRLWLENRELRENLHQHQSEAGGLAPLSQMKKTLARKLGGDSLGNVTSTSFSQESFEDNSKAKGSRKEYAQEDAEVLRSIVVQLQEEMKVLKEKLREADGKLQKQDVSKMTTATIKCVEDTNDATHSTLMDKTAKSCETCVNHEKEMRELIARKEDDQINIKILQKNLSEYREDLQKEAALRKQLEDQWQERREAHKAEVQTLRDQVKLNENELLALQQKFLDTKEEVIRQLQSLTDERERINKQLETLQADNDFLSGRYLASAEEIENQYINLPNTVEELQEVILKQQDELIQARVGSEFEKQKCVTSLDEIQILRDQLTASNNERRSYKKKVQTEIKSLQDRLTDHLLTLQNYETMKTSLERKEAELNRRISELRVEIIELQESNEKLSVLNVDYKAKIKNLQDDLSTSEQVQKDFVKLSQNLQMALEKLRKSDTEVRWQEDEDVDNCPTCNTYFTVTVRKIHCRHCGHIYCDKCLTKAVPSGPRKKIVRVCDICHTLLTPETAPYFSQEVRSGL